MNCGAYSPIFITFSALQYGIVECIYIKAQVNYFVERVKYSESEMIIVYSIEKLQAKFVHHFRVMLE